MPIADQIALPDAGADGVDDGREGLLRVGAGDPHQFDLVGRLDHAGVVHGGLGMHDLDAPLLEGLGVDVREGRAVDAERLLLYTVLGHEVDDLVDHVLDHRVFGVQHAIFAMPAGAWMRPRIHGMRRIRPS